MPKLSVKLPKYRRHSQRDIAFVELNGRRIYLPGKYGSTKSKQEHHRICLEWETQCRPKTPSVAASELTVAVICTRYWRFAKQYYRKRGKGTSEIDNVRYALRPLKERYAATLVKDFDPLALKALRSRMIEDGLSRGGKIKRVFRWAVFARVTSARKKS